MFFFFFFLTYDLVVLFFFGTFCLLYILIVIPLGLLSTFSCLFHYSNFLTFCVSMLFLSFLSLSSPNNVVENLLFYFQNWTGWGFNDGLKLGILLSFLIVFLLLKSFIVIIMACFKFHFFFNFLENFTACLSMNSTPSLRAPQPCKQAIREAQECCTWCL